MNGDWELSDSTGLVLVEIHPDHGKEPVRGHALNLLLDTLVLSDKLRGSVRHDMKF